MPEGFVQRIVFRAGNRKCFQQGDRGTKTSRIVSGAIDQLNDYVGYRPVAVLEGRRLEPYPHEWLRPIPLYIRDVGVAFGPYYEIVSRCLEIIRNTSPHILRDAQFDPSHLDEFGIRSAGL